MSRNSTGNYTPPAGNPVVTETTITSTWANLLVADLGNEITNSLDRGGRGGMLAALRLVNGTAAVPALAFNTESSTGLYRVSAGVLGWSVVSTLMMTLDSTGLSINGGLDITGAFDVTGNISVTGDIVADDITGDVFTGNSFVGPLTGNVTGDVTGTAGNITGIAAVPNGGTGANNTRDAQRNLQVLGAATQARVSAFTVQASDRGDVMWCSGSFTVSLTAAAILQDGFSFGIVNTGTGSIVIDPAGGETIDGLATRTLTPGQSAVVITDGANWRTVGLSGGGASGGGANQVFYENDQNVTTDYTISSGKNAMSAGPITINVGVTVTVPVGSTWVIV